MPVKKQHPRCPYFRPVQPLCQQEEETPVLPVRKALGRVFGALRAKKKHPPTLVKALKMLYSIFKQTKKSATPTKVERSLKL